MLPRVVDTINITAQLLFKLTDREVQWLSNRMGHLFWFTPSNPTGHYRLELGNRFDRAVALKLLEVSSEERLMRESEARRAPIAATAYSRALASNHRCAHCPA